MPATTSFDQTFHHTEVFKLRFASLALAFLFSGVLILGNGFVQSSTIHSAAHDGRHALGFPCH